jgi:cobalt-zinc-cadmium efflux system outer membrane protein
LGVPDFEPQMLAGELEKSIVELHTDETLQRLLAVSPEMSAALAEVARSRWALDRAYAEPIPNVDVQAVVQYDNDIGGTDANVQVTLPIPWLNRNQGGIRQAHAELVAAERAVGRVELRLQQRLATVFQQYASGRNQVEDYSKPEGILANSQAALELVRSAYRAGEIDYLDLLTAQRTNSQTQLAYLEALGELWAAIVEIEGLLLKDSLSDESLSAMSRP